MAADQHTPSLWERLGPVEARVQAENPGSLNPIALAFSLEIHSSDKLWVWLASQGFLQPSVQWKERGEGEWGRGAVSRPVRACLGCILPSGHHLSVQRGGYNT